MKLSAFYKKPNEITPDECQLLNRELSSKTALDIPQEHHKEVEEYMCTQLLYNAVEATIKPKFELLFENIRIELRGNK